jgi:hypothetical protein
MAAIGVLVIGQSGTGKSASMRNLPPKGTGVINIAGKRLPFRSSLKCVQKTSGADIIKTLLNGKAGIIVVDDLQYVLVNQFMARASEKTYQKFTDMAKDYFDIIKTLDKMPDNKRVYFLSHNEMENGFEKVKTIGKILDEKITVEGLFTIVLKTVVRDGQYLFATHNNGSDTVKSPMGMFEADFIENDLAAVDRSIRGYYGLTSEEEEHVS